MSKKDNKEPENKRVPLSQVVKGVEQLSDAQIKEKTRVYIPSAIVRLAELCNSTNPNVSLGAIKILLAKNLPDLKATELSTDDNTKFLFQIIQDNTLKDANKEDPTTDKAIPETTGDI